MHFQEINEVWSWLVSVLRASTPAVWLGAVDTLGDGEKIKWIHDNSQVNVSFWGVGEPDHDNGKNGCVCILAGLLESGLRMKDCNEMGYPLCNML